MVLCDLLKAEHRSDQETPVSVQTYLSSFMGDTRELGE